MVVKDKAAVDARSDVESCFRQYGSMVSRSRRHSSHIRAWASALPSLRPGQCQKPQAVGRRRVQIPRFFIANLIEPRRGDCGREKRILKTVNEKPSLHSDKLYKKEAYHEWLKKKHGLSKGSADSYISYMNSLNNEMIDIDSNGASFFSVLTNLINSNHYVEIIVLLEEVDRMISMKINSDRVDSNTRKKLNDRRSSLRRYKEFLSEELEDIPDEEEIEELERSFSLNPGDTESKNVTSESAEIYDYQSLEDNFRFRLLTQNRMSGKKDVFYPIGIIRKLFKYSQKNGLSSEKDYDWLIEWINDCVGEIIVLTKEDRVPLNDVDYLTIHLQSNSVEISCRGEGNQDQGVYTETNKEAEGKVPMVVSRLRDIHIDHSPLMSEILSDELPNLKALPKLTEIIKRVAKRYRIEVTTKNFGKISKKLFADESMVASEMIPMKEGLKSDLELLRKKSTLKLMEGKYNLKKK